MITIIIFVCPNKTIAEGVSLAESRGYLMKDVKITTNKYDLEGWNYTNFIILGAVEGSINALLTLKEVNCGCTIERIE